MHPWFLSEFWFDLPSKGLYESKNVGQMCGPSILSVTMCDIRFRPPDSAPILGLWDNAL